MTQNTTWKIGWLSPNPSPDAVLYGAFLEGMNKQGLVEGKNVEIIHAVGLTLEERARFLVDRGVHLIVSSGTPASQAAKDATRTTRIPIVMVAVGHPVRTGLVSNLENPDANLTGFATLLPQSSARRLELLKTMLPRPERVAVILNPDNPANRIDWEETAAAAQQLGLQLQRLEVRSPEGLEGAFAAASKESADALIVCVDPMLIIHRRRIAALAATHRLPVLYGLAEFAEADGLAAYGPCFPVMYHDAAEYVQQILVQNKQPSELPVREPDEFELTFNRTAAEAVGAALPSIMRFRFRRGREIP